MLLAKFKIVGLYYMEDSPPCGPAFISVDTDYWTIYVNNNQLLQKIRISEFLISNDLISNDSSYQRNSVTIILMFGIFNQEKIFSQVNFIDDIVKFLGT